MNSYGAVVVDVHASFTSMFGEAGVVDAIGLVVVTVTSQQVWGGRKGERGREEGEGEEKRRGEKRGEGGREGRGERGRRERKRGEVGYDNL